MGHSCTECNGVLGGPCDDQIAGYDMETESTRFWEYFAQHNADEPKCPLCGEEAVMEWVSEFIDDFPQVWAKCACVGTARADTIYGVDGLPQIKIWVPRKMVLKWSWGKGQWESLHHLAKDG